MSLTPGPIISLELIPRNGNTHLKIFRTLLFPLRTKKIKNGSIFANSWNKSVAALYNPLKWPGENHDIPNIWSKLLFMIYILEP